MDEQKKKKPVRLPDSMLVPHAPGNIRLSKKQFIDQERARKEKAIKVAEFAASLDKKGDAPQVKEEIKTTETKSRGRPKKIE